MAYDVCTLLTDIHDSGALRSQRHEHEGPTYTTGWLEARCQTAHDVARRLGAMGLPTPTFAEHCFWCNFPNTATTATKDHT